MTKHFNLPRLKHFNLPGLKHWTLQFQNDFASIVIARHGIILLDFAWRTSESIHLLSASSFHCTLVFTTLDLWEHLVDRCSLLSITRVWWRWKAFGVPVRQICPRFFGRRRPLVQRVFHVNSTDMMTREETPDARTKIACNTRFILRFISHTRHKNIRHIHASNMRSRKSTIAGVWKGTCTLHYNLAQSSTIRIRTTESICKPYTKKVSCFGTLY